MKRLLLAILLTLSLPAFAEAGPIRNFFAARRASGPRFTACVQTNPLQFTAAYTPASAGFAASPLPARSQVRFFQPANSPQAPLAPRFFAQPTCSGPNCPLTP